MTPSSLLSFGVLAFLLSMLFFPLVHALGVAPGRTIIDFAPNLVVTKEILLVNTEQQPLSLSLETTGDLAPYVVIPQARVVLNPGASIKIPYTVTLPQRFPHGGNFEGMIIAHQTPDSSSSEENNINIGAIVGVGSTLQVRVPYQGKALHASVTVLPADPYKPVEFLVQATNVGDETLDTVRVVATIFDLTKHVLAEVSSEKQTLQRNQRANFVATWDAQVPYGEYHAVITIFYDGQQRQVPTDFIIGHFPVDLQDLRVEDFISDEQAFFVTTLANTLDTAVDVTSQITLERDQQPPLALEEHSATIAPHSTAELKHRWQLAQVPYGAYRGTLTLTVGDFIARRPFLVELSSTGISASLVPFTPLTGATITLQPDGSGLSSSSPWLIWVILLLLAHLLFFAWYRRKQHQEKKVF